MRGMILATALCALSTAAVAQMPTVGERMVVNTAIVCDTREQVMDLFGGTKVDDGKGIVGVYLKYQAMKNSAGEPSCNIQPIEGPVVKTIEDLGETKGSSGNPVHTWLVELSGESGTIGFALYGEQIKGIDI